MRRKVQAGQSGVRLSAVIIAILLALPDATLLAQRRGNGGSVRQSRNNASRDVNRNVNRTNVNVNRNVNVNVNNRAPVARRGAVAVGEEGAVAVGRRGAVAVGEEGFVGVGRYGAVVGGERYESYEGWRTAAGVAAGVATGIAIGTMLARPPAAAVPVVVTGTSYMYADGAYYEKVYYGGQVSYRVVGAPPGAVIVTLPVGCTTTIVGNVSYQQCGTTYYQRVNTGYRVVVF
jgi:hypothetical protein